MHLLVLLSWQAVQCLTEFGLRVKQARTSEYGGGLVYSKNCSVADRCTTAVNLPAIWLG
jgi:hypothetical protein